MATTTASVHGHVPSQESTPKTSWLVRGIAHLLDTVFQDVVKENPVFTDRALLQLNAAVKKLPSGAQITASKLEDLLRWQIDCRRLRVRSYVAIAPRGRHAYKLRLLVGDNRKEVYSCRLARLPGKPCLILKAGHRYHELAVR